MVKIRLFRVGTTKRPAYRIVVVDSRRKRQGRVLEILGTYRSLEDGAVTLNEPALERWMQRGVQLSDTVRSLIRKHSRQASADPSAAGTAESAAAAESAAVPS